MVKRKNNKVRKEDISEYTCFRCKEGGKLLICDYKDCLKVYHPQCAGKDDSFSESDDHWNCNYHCCSICNKKSKFGCFFCPSAVCGRCLSVADFAVVKGDKGICRHCSKLAFLIEENADVDSDGEKIDFKASDTYEYLFSDYYETIKNKEGLNSLDVRIARDSIKNGKNKNEFDPFEIDESKEYEFEELNDTAGATSVSRKKKCTKKQKPIKGKGKNNKKDFTEELDTIIATPLEDREYNEERQANFAAITSSNMKLVFLKKSFIEELLKKPDTFESKVLGCFVRTKYDATDYLEKNSPVLQQVLGVNIFSKYGETKKEISLQLSNVEKAVPICKISNDDFSEEECQDLYQRMREGLLKKPTVLEIEQKARTLHEDMKQWIPRELALLQNRMDEAYKEWKIQVSEYNTQKKKLEKQLCLLSEIPEVIPETVDTNPSLKHSSRKGNDKVEQNYLPELATEETYNSVGKSSKHISFAQTLDKDTAVVVGSSNTEFGSGDTSEGRREVEDPDVCLWHCSGPYGERGGPYSMSTFKNWKQSALFSLEKYKVWKIGQDQTQAIPFPIAVRNFFQQ